MLEVDDALRILSNDVDLTRYRDEDRKSHVLMFESKRTAKQLALWLNTPKGRKRGSGVRIKVEKYSWNIPGVEPIECAKSDNLNNKPGSRIKNGQGECVFVTSSKSLADLISRLNGQQNKRKAEPNSKDSVSPSDSEPEVSQPKDDDVHARREVSIKEKNQQSQFRNNMLALYGDMCAVTECKVAEVLEAAHIFDHALSGINRSENGLLLRSDIHLLLDRGLIRINPDSMKIVVNKKLRETEYWQFNGRHLKPRLDGSQPERDYLQKRWYSENKRF